jgi:hypothetical protein
MILIHRVAVSNAITAPRTFSVISPHFSYNLKLTICKESIISFDTPCRWNNSAYVHDYVNKMLRRILFDAFQIKLAQIQTTGTARIA